MTSSDFNPDGEKKRRPVTARELRKAKEARERVGLGDADTEEQGQIQQAEGLQSAEPSPETTGMDPVSDQTFTPPAPEEGMLAELEEELQRAKDEVNRWKQEAEENYERILRARADLENFRRRTRKDQEELAKYAAVPMVESLLPVIDNLERALDAGAKSEEAEALHKGVDMICRQLLQSLEEHGLTPIEAEGREFNPHEHNAVMQVEADGVESGMVVEELQKGYRFKDRVIRPSMVKVSS